MIRPKTVSILRCSPRQLVAAACVKRCFFFQQRIYKPATFYSKEPDREEFELIFDRIGLILIRCSVSNIFCIFTSAMTVLQASRILARKQHRFGASLVLPVSSSSLTLTWKRCVSGATATAPERGAEQLEDNYLTKEYQYLPGGPLPTYYFQKSLPRLPIPKLELTCQRYLEAMRPLLTNEQYGKTEKYVADFQKGVGICKCYYLLFLEDM